MTPFNFSIRTALKQSWQTFVRHPLFFGTLAFVMIIFNLFSQAHKHSPVLTGIVIIAAIVWTYVWISTCLAAVDGNEDTLTFNSLSVHMPNVREFFTLIAIGILVGLIVAVGFMVPILIGVSLVSLITFSYIAVWLKILIVLGFMLLMVPGIYLLVRLMFATITYVDRQQGIIKSIKYSWSLVKGKVFWTAFLVLIMELLLVIGGSLLLLVGLLVTYPLAMLLLVHLYRALTQHHTHHHHAQHHTVPVE